MVSVLALPCIWNFPLCTFLSSALSIPIPSKQQQDPMVDTSCTDLYSQISSKHGRDLLACIPASIVGIIKALYLTYSSPWQQLHVLSPKTLSSYNSYCLMQEFIVFKYLKLQLRKFQLNLVFLQSAVIPWILKTWSGPKQETGNGDTWSRMCCATSVTASSALKTRP